jgi:fructosamine-3-kinase
VSLPASVRGPVEAALGRARGAPCPVLDARPLGGGSIHHALRLDTPAGAVFLKWNRGAAGRGFGAEARSLAALGEAVAGGGGDTLVIPAVLGWQDAADDDDAGWLALEYLPPAPPDSSWGARLGRGLAALHRTTAAAPGWPEDNLIGSLPQSNPQSHATWETFWRDARLQAQWRTARERGHFAGPPGRLLERVVAAGPRLLAAVGHEPCSLLHGDLWSGNVHPGPDGRVVLIDPASYYGHREVDLAIAELFGGIPDSTLAAYREAWPLEPGYRAVRRPLYQLYYLLVHVNLFGGGYVARTLRAAEAVARAL